MPALSSSSRSINEAFCFVGDEGMLAPGEVGCPNMYPDNKVLLLEEDSSSSSDVGTL
jgi:hypothetical protein